MLPERSTARALNATMKRALDMIVAGSALLVLAPLMLLIAAAIRIETPGPILFAQPRLARHGKPFRLFKVPQVPGWARGARTRGHLACGRKADPDRQAAAGK